MFWKVPVVLLIFRNFQNPPEFSRILELFLNFLNRKWQRNRKHKMERQGKSKREQKSDKKDRENTLSRPWCISRAILFKQKLQN